MRSKTQNPSQKDRHRWSNYVHLSQPHPSHQYSLLRRSYKLRCCKWDHNNRRWSTILGTQENIPEATTLSTPMTNTFLKEKLFKVILINFKIYVQMKSSTDITIQSDVKYNRYTRFKIWGIKSLSLFNFIFLSSHYYYYFIRLQSKWQIHNPRIINKYLWQNLSIFMSLWIKFYNINDFIL